MVKTRQSKAAEEASFRADQHIELQKMEENSAPPETQPLWFKSIAEKLDVITDTNKKVTEIQSELKELRATAELAHETAEKALQRAEEAEQQVTLLHAENTKLKSDMEAIKDRMIRQEAQSRRENLLFDGIQEGNDETWSDCEEKLYTLFSDKLGVQNAKQIKFERVHRIGPKVSGKPRTVIAKFSFYKDREYIWQRRTHLKSTNIWMSEDYPAEVKQARRVLFPIFRAAQQSRMVTYSSLRLDKLSINGTQYTVDSLSKLPEFLRPEKIATRKAGDVTVFYTRNAVFSNFYTKTPIKLDGQEYNTTEQYYQHAKAMFFNDDEKASQIMAQSDPHQQYLLGQQVRGFKDGKARWMPEGRKVLLKANTAKYEQHVNARQALLATGTDILGEASPDLNWGIGYRLNHKAALDKDKWTGKNVMGEILMQVRDIVKNM